MSLADVEVFLTALAERGLRPAEKGVSVDAVVSERYGSSCPCHWLEQADIHEAFLSLGCALICWRYLRLGTHK